VVDPNPTNNIGGGNEEEELEENGTSIFMKTLCG
jgi:hypothetical protein